MTDLSFRQIEALATISGLRITSLEKGGKPSLAQLQQFLAKLRDAQRMTDAAANKQAVSLARKHQLCKSSTPITIGERWIVNAIAEALLSK